MRKVTGRHAKARRLAAEGRIVWVSDSEARVRGDGGRYRIWRNPCSGKMTCNCPASGWGVDDCSHILAADLTLPDGEIPWQK